MSAAPAKSSGNERTSTNYDIEDDGIDSPPTFTGKGKGKAKSSAPPVITGQTDDNDIMSQATATRGSDSDRQTSPADLQQQETEVVGSQDVLSCFPLEAEESFGGSRNGHAESSDSDTDNEVARPEAGGEAVATKAFHYVC